MPWTRAPASFSTPDGADRNEASWAGVAPELPELPEGPGGKAEPVPVSPGMRP